MVDCRLFEDNPEGRGSEVENEVYGVLVNPSGGVVEGARVLAQPVTGGGPLVPPAVGYDSAFTDDSGRYAFKDLPAGRYNLFGDYQSGTLVVLIPDVDHFDLTRKLDVGVDTLRAPGRIRGRLLLGTQGKGDVLCHIPGTSYLATSDDSGIFVISGIPPGVYTVGYSSPGFLASPDTGVRVKSNLTTELPPRQLAVDPTPPPPPPARIDAMQDTLTGLVTVMWSPVPVSDIKDYFVSREVPGHPEHAKISQVADTVFADSGVPASLDGKSLVYRVRSRDRDDNLGFTYSPPDTLAYRATRWNPTALTWEAPRSDTVAFQTVIPLVVRFDNPTRRTVSTRWTWKTSASKDTLVEKKVFARSGLDTLLWKPSRGRTTFTFDALAEDSTSNVLERSLSVLSEREVYGVLVDPGGVPAAGARVLAQLAESVPGQASVAGDIYDTAYTDAAGRYAFADLPARRYNLVGDHRSGSLVVLIPGIDYANSPRRLEVGMDTLRAPGAIEGRLTFSGSGEIDVRCDIPGTSFRSVTDDSGRFTLRGVPQGRYSVRYAKSGFLVATDSGIAVVSGYTTSIGDKAMAFDPALPPPSLKAATAAYQAADGKVRVSWPPVPVSDLQGYVVYRDDPDLQAPKQLGIVTDTVFLDSLFPLTDSEQTFVYRVKAIDLEANLSLNYSPPSAVVAPVDTFGIRANWLSPASDTARVGEEVILVVAFQSTRDKAIWMEWRMGDANRLLMMSGLSHMSGQQDLDLIVAAGRTEIKVEITGQSGRLTRLERTLVGVP